MKADVYIFPYYFEILLIHLQKKDLFKHFGAPTVS